MEGVDIHLDVNIGKQLSALGHTLTSLSGFEDDEATTMDSPDSDDGDQTDKNGKVSLLVSVNTLMQEKNVWSKHVISIDVINQCNSVNARLWKIYLLLFSIPLWIRSGVRCSWKRKSMNNRKLSTISEH